MELAYINSISNFFVVEEIRGKYSNLLKGINILHCITSSVSLYRAIDISRFLIRHGANVFPVLSEEAQKLISPYLFEYATGNKPITKITGKVEHTRVFDEYNIDLLLIAPCTANTISKMANGISDSIVTLIASVALGKKIKTLIVPAMHLPMYENSIVLENIEKLKKLGIGFVEPRIEEEKAKMADENTILFHVLKMIKDKPLQGKKVLVTAGATREFIDSVRYISNPGSGKMGLAMAISAWYLGAEVYFVHGDLRVAVPSFLNSFYSESSEDMKNEILKLMEREKFHYFVSAASVSDFKPLQRVLGKIETKKVKSLKLELVQTEKIIRKVKELSPNTKLIAFKAEYGMDKSVEELIEDYEFCDYLIVNDVSRKDIGFSSEYNEVLFINLKKGYRKNIGKMRKEELSELIWNLILSNE